MSTRPLFIFRVISHHSIINIDTSTYLYPTEASPAQVISSSVKGDVQGVEVSGLPVEELPQVQCDEGRVDDGAEGEAVPQDGGHAERVDEQGPA